MIEERPTTRQDNLRILFKSTAFEKVSNQCSDEEELRESEEELTERENKQTIKSNSPFTEHFLQIQRNFTPTSSEKVNKLANLKFVEFLQSDFMPYIFLWGGFVLR